MTVYVDLQHPKPVYTVPLESNRSAVLYSVGFSQYLGAQGSLVDTEWVYDSAEITVTRETLMSQSELVKFESPMIGQATTELVSDAYVRAVTAAGGVSPPVHFKVVIRPDQGDPIP